MSKITNRQLIAKLSDQWNGAIPFSFTDLTSLPKNFELDADSSYVNIECAECGFRNSYTPNELLGLRHKYGPKDMPCVACAAKKNGSDENKVTEAKMSDDELVERINELKDAEEEFNNYETGVKEPVENDVEEESEEEIDEKSEESTGMGEIDNSTDDVSEDDDETDDDEEVDDEEVDDEEVDETVEDGENPNKVFIDKISDKFDTIEEFFGYVPFDEEHVTFHCDEKTNEVKRISLKCLFCQNETEYDSVDEISKVVELEDGAKYHNCPHCIKQMHKMCNKLGIWRNTHCLNILQSKLTEATDDYYWIVVDPKDTFTSMNDEIKIASNESWFVVKLSDILLRTVEELNEFITYTTKNYKDEIVEEKEEDGEVTEDDESMSEESVDETDVDEDDFEDDNDDDDEIDEDEEDEEEDEIDEDEIEEDDATDQVETEDDDEIEDEEESEPETPSKNETGSGKITLKIGGNSKSSFDSSEEEVEENSEPETETKESGIKLTIGKKSETAESKSGGMFDFFGNMFGGKKSSEESSKSSEEDSVIKDRPPVSKKSEETEEKTDTKKEPGIKLRLGEAYPDNLLGDEDKADSDTAHVDYSWKLGCQDTLGSLKKEKAEREAKWYDKKLFLERDLLPEGFNEFEDEISLLAEFSKTASGKLINEIEEKTNIPVKIRADEQTWDIPICDFASGVRVICLNVDDEGQMKSPVTFEKSVPFQFSNIKKYKTTYLYSDSTNFGPEKFLATKNALSKLVMLNDFDPKRVFNVGNNYALFYTDDADTIKRFELYNSPNPMGKPSNNRLALIAMRPNKKRYDKFTSKDILRLMSENKNFDLKEYNLYVVGTLRYIESPSKTPNTVDYLITDYTELTASIIKDGLTHLIGALIREHDIKHPGMECNVILEFDKSCLMSPSLEIMVDNEQLMEIHPGMIGESENGFYYVRQRNHRYTEEDKCRQDYRLFLTRSLMKRFPTEITQSGYDIRVEKQRKAIIEYLGFYRVVRPPIKTFLVSPLHLAEIRMTSSVNLMNKIDLSKFFGGKGIYSGGYDDVLKQQMLISFMNSDGKAEESMDQILNSMLQQKFMSEMMSGF